MYVTQHPGWIIAIFAVAALVLLAIGAIRVLTALIRFNQRLRALQAAPILADLDMLQLRLARLQEVQPKLAALAPRVSTATATLRDALKSAPLGNGVRAVREAGADIHGLVNDLR